MNLLLDTHVALWAITDDPRLSAKARDMIAAPRATIWISSVSLWEISIKFGLAKGDMPVSGTDAMRFFTESGYRFLAIEPEHTIAVEALPFHHHDPFDRLLVAQALVEPMRLMTHDLMVAKYSESIICV